MSKGLEALNSLFETMPFAFLESNTMKELRIIEKELKALEIIKNKKVSMISLLRSIEWINASHYNDSIGCPIGCELTKEEYDLLKEVLS